MLFSSLFLLTSCVSTVGLGDKIEGDNAVLGKLKIGMSKREFFDLIGGCDGKWCNDIYSNNELTKNGVSGDAGFAKGVSDILNNGVAPAKKIPFTSYLSPEKKYTWVTINGSNQTNFPMLAMLNKNYMFMCTAIFEGGKTLHMFGCIKTGNEGTQIFEPEHYNMILPK